VDTATPLAVRYFPRAVMYLRWWPGNMEVQKKDIRGKKLTDQL
jgi:hypothetical protein